MKSKKILLTGGHAATAALALVDTLETDKKIKWDIYWVGSKKATEGGKNETLEYKIFSEHKSVKNYSIISGRVQKKFTKFTLISLLKIPLGFLNALYIVLKINPSIIISFGGFAAFPLVFWGSIFGKKVIIHEQTVAVGMSNNLSSKFATKIAVSRKSSLSYFPKSKTALTGNLVQELILKIKPRSKVSKTPVIFITGGSRGSLILNKTVKKALPSLIKKYKIIHQSGDHDEKSFKNIKSSNYSIKGTLSRDEFISALSKADIAISRAGANTVGELVLAKIPSILIPIPWTRYDEQNKNAQLAQKCGVATILKQDELTKESLINKIEEVLKNWKKMASANECSEFQIDKKGTENMLKLIHSLA